MTSFIYLDSYHQGCIFSCEIISPTPPIQKINFFPACSNFFCMFFSLTRITAQTLKNFVAAGCSVGAEPTLTKIFWRFDPKIDQFGV